MTDHASPSALPTAQQMQEAESLSVLDASGKPIQFSSLLEEAKANGVAFVLIFTRHFHCGMCKQFVRALGQSSVLTDTSKVSLVIIGPGQAEAIEYYKGQVGNPPFQFFADPEVKFYKSLGVTTRTYNGGDEKTDKIPSHHSGSLLGTAASSVVDIIKSGGLALKGGDFKQLGGDFVWDIHRTPVLAHRMQHTRDHTEVSELEKAVKQAPLS